MNDNNLNTKPFKLWHLDSNRTLTYDNYLREVDVTVKEGTVDQLSDLSYVIMFLFMKSSYVLTR